MFRDSTTLANELTPAEQAAFEHLVRAVGFARASGRCVGKGRSERIAGETAHSTILESAATGSAAIRSKRVDTRASR